jgi:uncharacterized repeat protein (TIGR03803 family)
MDRFNLGPGVLSVCVAAALLAGCGVLRQAQDDMQPPTGVPGAVPHDSALARTNSTNYKVLYSFGAAPDGNSPRAGLIDAGGVLYGTTREGGSHECYDYSTSAFHYTCGTVFRITTGGTEKVLYSFGEDPDANAPNAALVDVGGTLYGTTELGGSYICGYSDTGYYPCGALFSVTKGGTEKVLHSFGSGLDGATPQAGLIDVGGTLYGTTSAGGLYTCGLYVGGCGTVFSITTGGTETQMHDFHQRRHPHFPFAGLIDAGRTLYGTTSGGAAHYDGAVFSITLGGSVKVLHNFNGTDGARPAASLIRVQGMLYGTTTEGGAYGGGTVFSLTTGGTENVLHSFGKGTDGSKPSAGLIDVQGMLYGTTRSGGGSPSCTSGCGAVFSVTTGGTENVLHSFGDGTDGAQPFAGLVDVKGTLYGTTAQGGTYGYGTVFALTP